MVLRWSAPTRCISRTSPARRMWVTVDRLRRGVRMVGALPVLVGSAPAFQPGFVGDPPDGSTVIAVAARMVVQAAGDDTPSALRIALIFLLIVAPIYLFMVFFVRIVREAYGFATPRDDGKPVRVCPGCDTTIVEPDYVHCPTCGTRLPDPPEDPQSTASQTDAAGETDPAP